MELRKMMMPMLLKQDDATDNHDDGDDIALKDTVNHGNCDVDGHNMRIQGIIAI
jgi:hypothetical protein